MSGLGFEIASHEKPLGEAMEARKENVEVCFKVCRQFCDCASRLDHVKSTAGVTAT